VQQLAVHVADAQAGVVVDGEVLHERGVPGPPRADAYHATRYVEPPELVRAVVELDDILE
jgi:hypothetical protein